MPRKIIIDKKTLLDSYNKNNQHIQSVAKDLNFSIHTIQKNLKLCGINRIYKGQRNKELDRTITKEYLIEEYINKKKSIKKIANEKLVTSVFIRERIKKFGIGLRERDVRIIHDLTGKKIGRLEVIQYDHTDNKSRTHWLCKCECGNIKVISSKYLSVGNINSCGCLRNYYIVENSQWFKNQNINFPYFVWGNIVSSSSARNLELTITPQYIDELYKKQNGLCALTKIPIRFHSKRRIRDGDASLDRIDSSKGYVEGNVQWVHKYINFMKQNLSEKYFISMCKLVAENN